MVGSCGQSKGKSYARQNMEELKNGPFTVTEVFTGGGLGRPQTVRLETMRAE